ncbi:MAG: phosphoribosylanthranilate isomerase [Acidobacteriaceae bacterium]|nr:phosphoribosylanthranilate isomerase [Acidobacteriaceae bacterium]
MNDTEFIVKVCGITREEDACIAVNAGANALGFNFYKKSPRYITPGRARQIAEAVPAKYLKVGVFVNESQEELLAAAGEAGLDVLQLYGENCAVPDSEYRVWRSIPGASPTPARDRRIEAYLLDAATPDYGGSGKAFDWSLAARFPYPAIIAGGLDSTNVAEAIAAAVPRGVDACSRLEFAPGKKDAQRLRAFLAAALRARDELARTEVSS